MNRRISALAAALTFGLVGNANLGEIPPPQTPKQRKRWADRRDYPRTGTGIRQGKRVERQVRGAFTHPFAASLLCIDRIRTRRLMDTARAICADPDIEAAMRRMA